MSECAVLAYLYIMLPVKPDTNETVEIADFILNLNFFHIMHPKSNADCVVEEVMPNRIGVSELSNLAILQLLQSKFMPR